MGKVVYNACYGGFGLSDIAMKRVAELKGIKIVPVGKELWWSEFKNAETGKSFYPREDYPRHDPDLVRVVEEFGDRASGRFARLRIKDLPDGTPYRIAEYDGFESVETKDAIEWSVA